MGQLRTVGVYEYASRERAPSGKTILVVTLNGCEQPKVSLIEGPLPAGRCSSSVASQGVENYGLT